MKKILLILVIALCNLFTIYAQDVINPPKFDFFTTSTGGYDTLVTRNFNHFYLSWNWGSEGSKLDKALMMNGYHGFPFDKNDVDENMLTINNTYFDEVNAKYYIVGGYNADLVLNAHCLHLEPTITVDSTQNFIPRAGDTTGAVFGWLNKNTGTNGTSGTIDFDRFILNRTSVTSPTLVLSNVWKKNALHWLDYDTRYNSDKFTNDVIENGTIDEDSLIDSVILEEPWTADQFSTK